jgi:hypothetical protein
MMCGTAVNAQEGLAARSGPHGMSEPEWTALTLAPMWVFSAVAGADGKLDAKEVAAIVQVMDRAPLAESHLLREVLEECHRDVDELFLRYRGDARTVDEGLSEVRRVLDRRASAQEGRLFRRGLYSIGVHVAKASGGGLFGRGNPISWEERAALSLLTGLLDLTPEELPKHA